MPSLVGSVMCIRDRYSYSPAPGLAVAWDNCSQTPQEFCLPEFCPTEQLCPAMEQTEPYTVYNVFEIMYLLNVIKLHVRCIIPIVPERWLSIWGNLLFLQKTTVWFSTPRQVVHSFLWEAPGLALSVCKYTQVHTGIHAHTCTKLRINLKCITFYALFLTFV